MNELYAQKGRQRALYSDHGGVPNYLVSVIVVLDVPTCSSTFTIIEIPGRERDGGEVPASRVEETPTGAAGPRAHAVAAHVVDHCIHVNVDLKGSASASVRSMAREPSRTLSTEADSMFITFQTSSFS